MTPDGTTPNDEMFSVAYDELRRLARGLKRAGGNPTLNATALVHEAYLKLSRATHFRAQSPQHLKYAVVRAMRQILLDAARRQSAAVRGGGDAPWRRVSLDDPSSQVASLDPRAVLAVGFALDDLAGQSELQARAFELQFFGGLQVAEIAELLGISEKKAQRLLRLARASLALALARGQPAMVSGSKRQ
jgi:RNA polymerase sigma factor (TIGR02999 family)